MFSLLPLLFLCCCSIIVRRYFENWRVAALSAAIITASILTAVTEALSLAQALSFYPLLAFWSCLMLAAGWKAWGLRREISWPPVRFNDWLLSQKCMSVMVLGIMVISAVTAAVSSPNTWDSMTYHLARVMHWIQDRSVVFYPTNIIRQLYSAPFAEFTIAHLFILGGGATSANFVQWMAMAGTLTAVSLVAGQLGAGRTGQWTAAAVAACLPMGILQSVSTQTDYVCAFWLAVFVFFLIEARRQSNLANCLSAGASLGLAFLTKGYSYIFALPFLIWFLGAHRRQGFFKGFKALVLVLACAAAINAGAYFRNIQSFGAPMWADVSLTNDGFNLKVFGENVLRNMSIHLATPFPDVNEKVQQVFYGVARSFGCDLNDPQASFGSDFNMSTMWLDEDYAGNLLHVALFAAVLVLAYFYPGRGPRAFYIGTLSAAFLLFCLVVRFQPWHSRFHLPLFVLFCPLAGVVLEYFLKQKSIMVVFILFMGAMPWLFLNDQHPWAGKLSIWKQPQNIQYFYKHADLLVPYLQAANIVQSAGCRQIGLRTGSDDWEYPWWVLLNAPGLRIEHVGVSNLSAALKYPLGAFQPCAFIVSVSGHPQGRPVWSAAVINGTIAVYLR